METKRTVAIMAIRQIVKQFNGHGAGKCAYCGRRLPMDATAIWNGSAKFCSEYHMHKHMEAVNA